MKSRKVEWAGHIAYIGEKSIYDLVEKYEGKRLFVSPSRRRKDNIKKDFKEIG